MKKFLIAGGAGFIGCHLAGFLSQKDIRVVIADNFSRGVLDPELETLSRAENVDLVNVDLLDSGQYRTLGDGYTHIFHLPAILGVQRVREQPYEVLTKNSRLVENMIGFAATLPTLERLLFASTSEVYAGTLQYFGMGVPTPETTPIALTALDEPRTSYMMSKLIGEAMCRFSGLPFTAFRIHNAYGPRMGLSHVIPQMLSRARLLKPGERFAVHSPGHSRTFCYIDDIVELLYRFATVEACRNETLNCGAQAPEITIEKLARKILAAVGADAELDLLEDTPGSPVRRAPDMEKTARLAGYRARTSIDDGIAKTYDWYRRNIFEGKGASAI